MERLANIKAYNHSIFIITDQKIYAHHSTVPSVYFLSEQEQKKQDIGTLPNSNNSNKSDLNHKKEDLQYNMQKTTKTLFGF